ncbi:MAG: ATP-binding cassette domain-containing protein, partial [Chitinophagaceae bacterium]
LQMLLGLEAQDNGKINIGDTVIFGNFSQSGLEIKEDVRVIEYVKNIAEHFPLANGKSLSAAQFLELFLFTPQQQFTYLNSLSGGEKKRLQLLSILFKNPNFLILDEPTNDLDLATLAVLENFLSEYAGCLLIVSHDRYFMDRLVDHLFVFEGDGNVRDFPGNYSAYRVWLKEQEILAKQSENKNAKAAINNSLPSASIADAEDVALPEKKVETPTLKQKKLSYKEQREFELLEKEMPALEKEREEITVKMTAPNLPYEELQPLTARITEVTKLLEEKEMRWLELSEMV